MRNPHIRSRWVVACVGHRRLPHEERVASVMRERLQAVRVAAGQNNGTVVAESSIAAGADTLFAEQALAAGMPWRAILPMPEAEFSHDFTAEEWGRASECLKRAIDVVVGSLEIRLERLRQSEIRASAYLDAGLRMLDEADLLLAVWDGEPARGHGGTAEIIAYAKTQGKPVLWICSKTGEVKKDEWASFPFYDQLMSELHALPGIKSAPAATLRGVLPCSQSAVSDDTGRKAVLELYQRADAAAVTKGWSYRAGMIWTLVLQSGAVILAPAVLTRGYTAAPFVLCALLCVVGVLTMLVILSWRRPQHRQARYRFAAELCRSAHAVWASPLDLSQIWHPAVPEFNRLVISLRFARLEQRDDCNTNANAACYEADGQLQAFKTSYEKERLQDEADYFRKQLLRAKKQGRIEPVAVACSGLTALVLIAVFAGILAGHRTLLHSWLLFIPAFAPVVASTLISLAILFDVRRRKVRYDAMLELIESAEARLRLAQSQEAVRRVVEPIERALLAEAREWYYLAMHSAGV